MENGKPTSQIKVKDTRKAREVRAERLESEGLGPILNLIPAVGRYPVSSGDRAVAAKMVNEK